VHVPIASEGDADRGAAARIFVPAPMSGTKDRHKEEEHKACSARFAARSFKG
jgi:hypothetical protein